MGTLAPEYLSIDEAADAVGVSTHTVRSWVEKGLLPTGQVSPKGRHHIDPRDLSELLRPRRRP